VLDARTQTAAAAGFFFESSSPLRSDGGNWFLRELRGRYDVVLKVVATKSGECTRLVQAFVKPAESGSSSRRLSESADRRFELIERKLPIFA